MPDLSNLNDVFDQYIEIMDEVTDKILSRHPAHLKFKEAWKELKLKNNDIANGIRRLTSSQLDEVGLNLTQKQGQLKIGLLKNSIQEWKNIRLHFPLSFKYREALKKVLNYLNIILGSLSGIYPPIEIFKELKEIAEQMLTDIFPVHIASKAHNKNNLRN